jgi:uncharacterized protein YqgQ
MTSKRDYEAVAAIFARQRELKGDPKRVQMIEIISHELADYFAAENPRFDRARFLQACEEVADAEEA